MSKVNIIEFDEISELFWLIEGYPFKPYSQYPQFDSGVLSEAFFKEIQKIAIEHENHIIAVKENRRPVALCIARKSGVESAVFRKKIYAITHIISAGNYKDSISNKQKMLRFFKRQYMHDIGMVSCRANSEDLSTIHSLETEAYRYMDNLVTYTFDLKQLQSECNDDLYNIRTVQNSDCDALKKITRDSQFMDRFHNDPHISKEKSKILYETFIENAMKGIGADTVFVAECDNKVAGFNTIASQNHNYSTYGINAGSFVLNAVAPGSPNRGIYSSLMNKSLLYLKDSADLIEIRTHAGNIPVHRALSRIGFRLSLSQLTFHAWNTNIMSLSGAEKRNECKN